MNRTSGIWNVTQDIAVSMTERWDNEKKEDGKKDT